VAFSLEAIFGVDTTGVSAKMKSLRKDFNDFVNDYAKLGAGVAVAAFVALSKGAIDLAGRLSDTSTNIGINVEALQALEAQHKRNGVPAEQLTKALEKLREASQKAREGDEKTIETFRKLGITWTEIAAMPLEQKYERIARAVRSSQDPAAAYNAVCELFGAKIGPKMMGSLNELATVGFPKLSAEAKKAGDVLSAETIAQLDKAGDAIDDFKRRAQIAVGNILVNFSSADGLKLLGLQFMKVLGTFGAGIVDAVVEGGQMAWAVFRGTFMGVTNFFRDGLLEAVIAFAQKFNDALPDFVRSRGWTINIAGLEDMKSAGFSISDEITRAIAQTSPSTFKQEVGAFWDQTIADQQKVVDALVKRDFGKDADQLRESGKNIEQSLAAGAAQVAAGGAKAAAEIKEAARVLASSVTRVGKGITEQTDASLRGARANLANQLNESRDRDSRIIDPFTIGGYKSAGTSALASELAAIDRELAERNAVRSVRDRLGEDAARARFGDTVTDKALRDMATDSSRTAVAIESLNSNIRNLNQKFGIPTG
jgi:hypothetical protein